MSRKIFQEKVKRNVGYIFSEGTHDYEALLAKAYDFLCDFSIRTDLRKEIGKALGVPEGKSAELLHFYNDLPDSDIEVLSSLWNEEVFYFLENLSPSGYYFGTQEGDGSCFGWFKVEEL